MSRPTYLKLVISQPASVPGLALGRFETKGKRQLDLFPAKPPRSLVLAAMAGLTASRFRDLLAVYDPAVVLDLRPFPVFDLPGYDRKAAFADMNARRCRYEDAAGLAGTRQSGAASLDPALLAPLLAARLGESWRKAKRATMILVTLEEEAEPVRGPFAKLLSLP
ncbi:MAG: hypothetical protein K2Q10_14435, partial [Rhodospirillales bacterium]|nr:hypothetical protein [Rhodospirillales bacterium]